MDKRKLIGILLMLIAVSIAGINISKYKKDSAAVQKTTTVEQTTEEQATEEVTTDETVIDNTSDSSIDISVPDNFYGTDFEPIIVKYPGDDVMAMVDNDRESLEKAVQAFVNGYGYGNAKYADYAGDIKMNTNDGIVEMTYYLEFERDKAIYFYVTYDKNTKQWDTRLA